MKFSVRPTCRQWELLRIFPASSCPAPRLQGIANGHRQGLMARCRVSFQQGLRAALQADLQAAGLKVRGTPALQLRPAYPLPSYGWRLSIALSRLVRPGNLAKNRASI